MISKMMGKWSIRKTRKLHRRIVWGAAAFLLVASISGLLWAYAPYLYWAEGYRKPKHHPLAPKLALARLSVSDVLQRMDERFGEEAIPLEVTLATDAGLLLYQVKARKIEGATQVELMDARSGVWLSPLGSINAIRFARQYVAADPPLAAVEFLEAWVPRRKTDGRPAWHVKFGDAGETEIFIDPHTGGILEDQDRIRKFHFFVMDIHQLNFFGFHKTLTIIPGALLLFMIMTGIAIWFRSRHNQREKKVIHQSTFKVQPPIEIPDRDSRHNGKDVKLEPFQVNKRSLGGGGKLRSLRPTEFQVMARNNRTGDLGKYFPLIFRRKN